MKTLFALLAFLPFASYAQLARMPIYVDPSFVMDGTYNFDANFSSNWRPTIYKEAKVKSFNIIKNKKDGSQEVVSESKFNTDGKLVYQKNDYATTEKNYNGLLLTDVVRNSKRNKVENHADFDDQDRITKITVHENGKLKKEIKYEYFEGNKFSQTLEIRYGRKVHVSNYVTEYDPILKTPIASKFYSNGKLKARYTYTCDTKGQLVEKKVTDVTSCHYDAKNNDGSYIEYTRTINDGKVYLTESYYTKDSVLTEQKSFAEETKLTYHYVISGNTSTAEYFHENGKRFYKTVQTRDSNGNVLSQRRYGKTDKKEHGYDAVYNEHNLATHIQYLNKKESTDYIYTFY